MGITMIGIDHNKANIDIRSMFAFSKKNATETMMKWKEIRGLKGCIILSTCNRMEIWAHTRHHWDNSLIDLVCELRGVDPEEYGKYFVERSDDEAISHLFYLTSGLKSMILAEDQIITQVKDALLLSREAFATDNVLEVLFRTAITAGKRVRSEVIFTRANKTAMDQAIEKLKADGFPFAGARCMVIGNGGMGKLAALSLMNEGAEVTVTIRQYHKGIVDTPNNCERINYGDRLELLPECDIVVSATTSPNFTLTAEQIRETETKPGLVLVDLAVPRDFEQEIATIDKVSLYTIDDFSTNRVDDTNEDAWAQADAVISDEIAKFQTWYGGRSYIPRVDWVKNHAMEDLDFRLRKAYNKLPMTREEQLAFQEIVDKSAGKIVTKLIYGLRDYLPIEEFRDALDALEKIYGKDEDE